MDRIYELSGAHEMIEPRAIGMIRPSGALLRCCAHLQRAARACCDFDSEWQSRIFNRIAHSARARLSLKMFISERATGFLSTIKVRDGARRTGRNEPVAHNRTRAELACETLHSSLCSIFSRA